MDHDDYMFWCVLNKYLCILINNKCIHLYKPFDQRAIMCLIVDYRALVTTATTPATTAVSGAIIVKEIVD